MALLEITPVKKLTATVCLEESTAKLVDQYAAFLKAPADDVVNKALEYVFAKDKEFQQFRDSNADARTARPLRVKPLASSAKATGAARSPAKSAGV